MKEKKKTYREINGTTRVGDFLRSIGQSGLIEKVLGGGMQVLSGNYFGAVKTILKGADELTPEQREYSLKLLESDIEENKEITKRWEFDMRSDSWLSKNVRPMMLIYLTLFMSVFAVLDSAITGFTVVDSWISLLSTLLVTVFVAYFGGRSFEKTKKI